ncbi:MAG TPA: transcription elongation factor GreA [Candidatus Dormibacteraeota bacterium]|jgi:transcription elongation factor GreA
MATEIPITAAGLAEVKRELDDLVQHRRPEIVSKIKAAREHGDLSENFEYHSARNEQSFIEGRIQELEAIVRNHKLIQQHASTGRVELLSTVHFSEDGGPEESYQLVGPAEADPKAGRVSHESAVGKALLGRQVGDEVEVVTDTGFSYTVKITSID